MMTVPLARVPALVSTSAGTIAAGAGAGAAAAASVVAAGAVAAVSVVAAAGAAGAASHGFTVPLGTHLRST